MENMLDTLPFPHAVKDLSLAEKQALAKEVRARILQVVSHNGGHLAPSLGVVELTIALLTVFEAGKDPIIWDVGHQTYPWKLLTGRVQAFPTIRTKGGLSGFPKCTESMYDAFGTGHASTSISAALGFATARDLSGTDEHVIAIIGDGALTGGMALEALNHAGGLGKRLIVILNDNEMSISENVGALSLFLSRGLSHSWMRRFKLATGKFFLSIPKIGKWVYNVLERSEHSFKSFFTPGMLFEAFRFNYIGPVNGHDVEELERSLRLAKDQERPVLLHVRTIKGKGYSPAEQDPARFHGISSFEPETGLITPPTHKDEKIQKVGLSSLGFTKVLGNTLKELGAQDNKIVVISAAMPDGTGTKVFQQAYSERFFDVGICEEHAVTFAAGLASKGFKPVVAIYSTFLQRAYDQILHDVCLQNLPVVFCVDRAGLVGEDGPTHHGMFDLTFLRSVPNMRIIAPRDEIMLRHALYTALSEPQHGPIAIRYPRRSSRFPGEQEEAMRLLPEAQGEILVQGLPMLPPEKATCLLAVGLMAHMGATFARLIGERTGITPTVFDAIWVKPLPAEQILALAQNHKRMVLLEENTGIGGFGSAVLELLADTNLLDGMQIKRFALPDAFVEHGSVEQLFAMLGFSADVLADTLQKFVEAE